MPSSGPPPRYTVIAFVIVVVLVALTAANRGLLVRLMDPAGTIERQREQDLRVLGSAEKALSSEQAHELLARFVMGESAAGLALVHQDQKNGLPLDFRIHLQTLLAGEGNKSLKASSLIRQMARHRAFDADVERVMAAKVYSTSGGTNTWPINTLGDIGSHRALSEQTLTLLLEVALAGAPADRVALAALEKTAKVNGLPAWALDELEGVAQKRPGVVRSDAIKVIAVSGARGRAMTIASRPGNAPVNRETIASMLKGENLTQLERILRDSSLVPEIRMGALTQIVKRRDQSERVGKSLSYAFTSSEAGLRLTAFNSYAVWGRHHARHIDVDWRAVCARAFEDDNESIRVRAASNFRFIPFADLRSRDRFLLDMLNGTEMQQHTALRATLGGQGFSDAVKLAAVGLAESGNADIAGLAGVLRERYRPKGLFEGLGSWLAGALLWFLLVLPAFTAVGFETYFVARLLQRIAGGGSRVGLLLVCIAWFALSIGLGLVLLTGVMAVGHGGGSGAEIYLVLLVVNAVFAGIAMFLRSMIRKNSVSAP